MQDLMTVAEVAEYLRIKERKVYDLLAHKSIPCTRVTGKWLFPRFQIDRWLEHNSAIEQCLETETLPSLLVGSHDLLLEWALRESRFPFAIQTTGSSDGLTQFVNGRAMVCGLHILDIDSGEYNIPVVKNSLNNQPVVLISWAKRQQGLVIAAGNPLAINQFADLKNKYATVIDRQAGAGSNIFLEALLKQHKMTRNDILISPQPAISEIEVGAAVANGKADVGIAIEAVAKQFQLDFIPLATESFDLVIHHRHYFNEPFQRLLAFTKLPQFQEKADEFTGYDISELGHVRFNGLA